MRPKFSRIAIAVLATLTLTLATKTFAQDTEKVLFNIQGGAYGYQVSGFLPDLSGNFYVTTYSSGNTDCPISCGLLFKLSPNANGQLVESIIHSFTGATDGDQPNSVVMDASGNLFVSAHGGSSTKCVQGCGAIVEFSPIKAGGYKTTVLYDFAGGIGGFHPEITLIDAQDNLYGWENGGSYGQVFQLSPSSSGTWTHKVLYTFKGSTDGADGFPHFIDVSGNIFGSAAAGGNATDCLGGCGTIFELSPNTNGTWTFNVIYTFLGYPGDGWFPEALVPDAAGNIFGTTAYGGDGTNSECVNLKGCGTLFELSPSGGGYSEAVLHSFNDALDGNSPFSLLTDTSGNLFTNTFSGGVAQGGLVLEFSPQVNGPWEYTILHAFATDGKGGAYPETIFLDSSDNVFGFAYQGGTKNNGVIFELSPAASEKQ